MSVFGKQINCELFTISDSIESEKSDEIASSKAVKKINDKLLEQKNLIENNKNSINEINEQLNIINSKMLLTGTFLSSFLKSMEGFLLCDGSAVSRETYADLFAVIGTKFGEGDGSTTFNLPDFRGRFIQGANGDDIGVYRNSGLPNVYGAFVNSGNTYNDLWDSDIVEGAAFVEHDSMQRQSNSNTTSVLSTKKKAGIDASRFNPIYGSSEIVQPPAITLNVFIKY